MSQELTFKQQYMVWYDSTDRKDLTKRFMDLLQSINRDNIAELIHELYIKTHEKYVKILNDQKCQALTFFDQPASTKFHGATFGGLVKHSLQVYDNFMKFVPIIEDRYHVAISMDTIIIATLLHDLCKWNLYVPKVTLKGFFDGRGAWGYDDEFPVGHGEKSIAVIQKYIDLTETEMLLIRWHMGPFDHMWQWGSTAKNVKDVIPWIDFMYLADHLASVMEGIDD